MISEIRQGGPEAFKSAPVAPMDLKTTRAADGAITTHVPGAPSGGFGDPSALFQALIKNRLQKGSSGPAQYEPGLQAAPQAPAGGGGGGGMMRQSYAPSMGAAPMRPSLGVQRSMPRYSYMQAPTQMAGTAPVLPVMSGYGVEGQDFTLEGGDVRALTSGGRAGGGPSSPPVANDARMTSLVEAQRRARG